MSECQRFRSYNREDNSRTLPQMAKGPKVPRLMVTTSPTSVEAIGREVYMGKVVVHKTHQIPDVTLIYDPLTLV